jgi:hypothetical protein
MKRIAMAEEEFTFTEGLPLTRGPLREEDDDPDRKERETYPWNVTEDPRQREPLDLAANGEVIERLKREMVGHLRECEAPREQYRRMGLENVAR